MSDEAFLHHLKTGSGWTKVELRFLAGEDAQIEYDSRWMSSGINRYRLGFRHRRLSNASGVLHLHTIQRYVDAASTELSVEPRLSELIEWDFDDDASWDAFKRPYDSALYEYVVLPAAVPWIADAPDLDEMKDFFGLAKWDSAFELLLWTNYPAIFDPGVKWTNAEIKRVLRCLDKLKFARV
ncbi:MAG: hypothetical protein IT318_13000 [Anaerolineales bacterium]|nr:hypothetical protein [Anaerolineales bacterium]